MSWDANSPTKCVEARDAMMACAASAALATSYHYPDAPLKTTAFPFAVLRPGSYRAERSAHGESYGRGSVVATFYVDPSVTTPAAVEAAAATLCAQLAELTGEYLLITSAECSMASRVRRAKAASAADGSSRQYVTIEVTVEWEG